MNNNFFINKLNESLINLIYEYIYVPNNKTITSLLFVTMGNKAKLNKSIRKVKCDFCNNEYIFEYLKNHLYNCPKIL